MNKEKQIEEMKFIIDKAEEEYSELWNEWFYDHKEGTKIDNEFLFFAKMLYDVGYRKASEVASEIFEEIDRMIYKVLNDQHYIMGDMCWEVNELKKKYIGEDTNVLAKTEGKG